MMNNKISHIIAAELQVRPEQILAAIQLLDGGSKVPFVARYRKEMTGGLDDTHLRQLENRLRYLRELNDRKKTVLRSIEEQGKLTDALSEKINGTLNKTELEDLYLPYKPKRRTRGQIAIEAGLLPLADLLWSNPDLQPETEAENYIDSEKEINNTKAALDGARYILMERFTEDAALLAKVRHYLWHNAYLVSIVIPDMAEQGSKYKDYFEYRELISKIPSHRALAMFRGRNEGILQLNLDPDPLNDGVDKISYGQQIISDHLSVHFASKPTDAWRQSVINWTWRIKILVRMETELMGLLRENAEVEAIKVFANNLKDMLMAAPAGMRVTMGMDPGLRTGVKLAVVDVTGRLLATDTIYPHTGKAENAAKIVASFCLKHQVELVAIGNGTACRETERFFLDTVKCYPDIKAQKVVVSEAGASVYSASQLAAEEFPELDVSLRGAVSIARRLQDPMAELVKIESKSIGIGQYQHDVSQTRLSLTLDAVVEDCVNAVGVDLNTASVPLLTRVAGLNKVIAQNIIDWRDNHGHFRERNQLLEVNRLGVTVFQQCAGFLRINEGKNPLDSSAVHPEAYPVVEKILSFTKKNIKELIADRKILSSLNAADFTDNHFGLPTVIDIIKELEKPGRDPRPEFKTAHFLDDITTIKDLKIGMIMEGVVSNVTNFGAFVDIGVHQDGLVHISSIARKFVKDPRSVVKTGDIIKVKVTGVDIVRKRIALSMRLDEAAENNAEGSPSQCQKRAKARDRVTTKNSAMNVAFAAVLGKLKP